MAKAGALTARSIASPKLERNKAGEPRQTEISDQLNGLYLVAYPSGARSWAVRYRNAAGKQRKVMIGNVDLIDVKDARHRALEIALAVAKGDDPAAKPTGNAGAVVTVADAVAQFLAWRTKQKRNRSLSEVSRQFDKYVLRDDVKNRPIADVTDDEAYAPVRALSDAGKAAMANRLHATLSVFWRWCASKERKMIAVSPYVGFEKPNAETSRDRVLSWTELAKVWEAVKGEPHPFGPIVRLLILTGQRRSEVAGMAWSELNLAANTWTLPPARAKNDTRHTVPLNKAARCEIEAVMRLAGSDLLFSRNGKTGFSGFSKGKARIDAAVALNEAWTFHDLRRTFSTGLEKIGVPLAVTEALLNHVSGAKAGVAGVYARHDYGEEKRHAIAAWGRFVCDVVLNEAARETFEGLEDTRPVKEAIQARDADWQRCVEALRGGADAWRAYVDPVQVAA